MRTRFRTLLLAGAASLAMSAAVAQVTTNGVPSTISQIVQVVWNGQNVSTSNPLPVNVAAGGGGSVTSAGTNGTTAQAVQGINGGVPLPIQGGNANAVKTDGSATTQPVSAAALPLPAGAATAANQSNEIAQLTAANLRAQMYVEAASGTAIAANATIAGPSHDLGGMTSPFTRINAKASFTAGSGTLYLQESNDNFATGGSIVTATGTAAALTAPITSRYWRAVVIKDGTAGAIMLFNSSVTAN